MSTISMYMKIHNILFSWTKPTHPPPPPIKIRAIIFFKSFKIGGLKTCQPPPPRPPKFRGDCYDPPNTPPHTLAPLLL